MKELLIEITDEFYREIIDSPYFSVFFVGKDLDHIKNKVYEMMQEQITCSSEEVNFELSYKLGKLHAERGIPLTNILNFFDHFNHKIFKYCDEHPELRSKINFDNFLIMKNLFAKGYLHESVKKTDPISIPLFSVFSTTKISTSVISWMMEIAESILKGYSKEIMFRSNSSNLIEFLHKPFFNMVFENENNFYDFNKMHIELHNTANSLFYFIKEKNYVQSYFVYSDFVEQCKSFMNFYFERMVLFEQNKENYFYRFARQKVSYGKKITLFTFNIRNMQMINKVWGHENGDFLVNEVERIIDRFHGMNSDNSVFIKTQNAEFIVMMINSDYSESRSNFDNIVSMLTGRVRRRGEFTSDMKISSSFIPLGDDSGKYINHLKEIIIQAVAKSKLNETEPLICDSRIIDDLNKLVMNEEKIRHFIRQSFNRDNFRPYYHTIISAATGKISHMEVLARVCDEKTCVSAGSFIDYLVQTDRIIELDKVMLEKVQDDFDNIKKITDNIFINVSPRSLRSPSFIAKLHEFINTAKEKSINTVYEITEQSLFDNIETVKYMNKKYGSVFAIDDFGSGYSNFSIVSDLAQEGLIKYLKIDGSLISDIHSNTFKEHIVAGIISIAASLDLFTVAEFIADQKTAEIVTSLGVTHMQGFHFSIPSPLSELPLRDIL